VKVFFHFNPSTTLVQFKYFKVLDQIIDDFAELIQAHYDTTEFADPSVATDVCSVLCFYMLTSEGKYRRKLL